MKNKRVWIIIMVLILAVFYGCGNQSDEAQKAAEEIGELLTADADETDAKKAADEPTVLKFVDAYRESHQMEVNPNVAPNLYDRKAFLRNGNGMSYGK